VNIKETLSFGERFLHTGSIGAGKKPGRLQGWLLLQAKALRDFVLKIELKMMLLLIAPMNRRYGIKI